MPTLDDFTGGSSDPQALLRRIEALEEQAKKPIPLKRIPQRALYDAFADQRVGGGSLLLPGSVGVDQLAPAPAAFMYRSAAAHGHNSLALVDFGNTVMDHGAPRGLTHIDRTITPGDQLVCHVRGVYMLFGSYRFAADADLNAMRNSYMDIRVNGTIVFQAGAVIWDGDGLDWAHGQNLGGAVPLQPGDKITAGVFQYSAGSQAQELNNCYLGFVWASAFPSTGAVY